MLRIGLCGQQIIHIKAFASSAADLIGKVRVGRRWGGGESTALACQLVHRRYPGFPVMMKAEESGAFEADFRY